ncbi:Retinitis pigmentosa 1-like 1 protein [Galemys pyrenaicus]|uniref:Retinitis pigmentosa 1-like 1 protein n=1 Tax=Galemys pyrenaicus TaxID=202257 RepID=A0A8J5ZSP7_GALPY|nr:Retinitis pigmentosa 1-like 1 protein [Galemys pyrenaicus]
MVWPSVGHPRSCSSGPSPSQGRGARGGGRLGAQEDSGVAPRALARASPAAVVHEWLSGLLEEPALPGRELASGSWGSAWGCPGGPGEGPADGRAPESLGDPAWARRRLAGAVGEDAALDGALTEAGGAGPGSGEGPPACRAPAVPRGPGPGKRAASGCSVGRCVLPSSGPGPAQLVRPLLGSRWARACSLPKLSGAASKRLSHRVRALRGCLVRPHFLGEDLGSPTRPGFAGSPGYQELLDTFRGLWLGCSPAPGGSERSQGLLGLGPHVKPEDLTPTSSSGVDVGSGGSGEGSGPLASERAELPSETPKLRPDSRASRHRAGQRPSGPEAPSSRAWVWTAREAGTDGEQAAGSNWDQALEDTGPEEGVQPEGRKEGIQGSEPQGEGAAEDRLPEEAGGSPRAWPGADAQEAEGARGGKGVQDKEAGAVRSCGVLCPPERRGDPTERPGSFSEGDPGTQN